MDAAHYQDSQGNLFLYRDSDGWQLARDGGAIGCMFGDLDDDAETFGATTAESVIKQIGESIQGNVKTYGELQSGGGLPFEKVLPIVLVIAASLVAYRALSR